MLCTLILNGQTEACVRFPGLPATSTRSSPSASTPANPSTSRKKKAIYMGSFDRPAPGWHFLTDHDGNAKRLAELVGFHYRYDPRRSSTLTPRLSWS